MTSVFTRKNFMTGSRSCKTLALAAAFSLMAGSAVKAQTVYALSGTNLISFSPTTPGTVTTIGAVTGIPNGQTIEGMDFRPATGQLFALGYNSSSAMAQLYTINLKSGAATAVGSGAMLVANLTNIGFDFNPTVDRIRVTGSGNQNWRMNPITGGLVQKDGDLNYGSGGSTPNVVAAAYTNSYLGTGTTTMYVYDYANNTIAASTNPNAGTLTPGGSSTITPASATGIDMDISYNAANATNSAYLLATVGGGSGLYTVNLMTGAATAVGAINASNVTEMAVYFAPIPVSKIVYALGGTNNNMLMSFNSATPATVRNTGMISGLGSGLSIVGMDFRPATGQLFALGYQASSGSAQVYIVDTVSAALTAVGGPQILAIGMTRVGFDFNPSVDRIRVTAASGQNYRLNPNDGSIVANNSMLNDGNLNYAAGDTRAGQAPGVVTVAYNNNIAGSATTMLVYDATGNNLASSSNPNAGVLNTIATLNLMPSNPDRIDMDISTNNTNGANFALFASSDSLYAINPVTGVIGLLGLIGGPSSGAAVTDIAIYIAPPTPVRMAYAISGTNLVSFASNAPGTITGTVAISNLTANQTIAGLDYRPATNSLYAFGYNAATGQGQLYSLALNGALTAVGTAINLPAGITNIGFDFNPTVDRIRFTTNTGLNYRLNPDNGAVAVIDGNLAYSTTSSDINSGVVPSVAAVGYTNSFSTNLNGSTTLYYYDYGNDAVATTSAPNNGTLNTVGNSGIMTSTATGLDMDILYNGSTSTNTAFLSATVAGSANPNLYTVNTRTGELRLIGTIGAPITAMAFVNFDPLPVTLVDFTGRKLGSSSELTWTTQSEANSSHFLIERSSDGINFKAVSGQIKSQAVNGNSTQRLQYAYTDATPAKGINYYRLVQVDRDNKTTSSKTVLLRFNGGYNISLYPNPASSFININGNVADRSDLQIRLSDLTGKTISTTLLKGQSGNWSTQLPASRLAAGTYYITITKDNEVIHTEAIQKK